MSVTPDKNHPGKTIADILSSPKKKVHALRKYPIHPKKGTKPHY